jgi:Tfp pilus assembly protein PilF
MVDVDKQLSQALAMMAAEDFKKAYNKFDKIIKEAPESAEAYHGKAEAGMLVPKVATEEVVANYQKAIELDPKNPFYLTSFGAFCIDVGKFNDAEQAYSKAAELDPENAPHYYSEFAVDYFRAAPEFYEQYLDEKTMEMIKKKALTYLLKAIGLDEAAAKSLL